MTITFHLTHPDGAFLDIMAMPFAFAVPAGMPYKDISTDPAVARGDRAVHDQDLRAQAADRARSATPTSSSGRPTRPNGHLNGVTITDRRHARAGGERDDRRPARLVHGGGAARPADRSSRRSTPSQVHMYPAQQRHLLLDERAARRRSTSWRCARRSTTPSTAPALVKIFGGQGTPTETVLPPGFGAAYHEPNLYPHDVAKAKALVAAGRGDRRAGAGLDDERRPGPEGGPVPRPAC